jgi:hypothetical protein
MATEEHRNDQEVDIKTSLFGLRLIGQNSFVILLFLMQLVLIGIVMFENRSRSIEHKEVYCLVKLNLYVNTLPKNEILDWAKLPVDLYECIPRFFYQREFTR